MKLYLTLVLCCCAILVNFPLRGAEATSKDEPKAEGQQEELETDSPIFIFVTDDRSMVETGAYNLRGIRDQVSVLVQHWIGVWVKDPPQGERELKVTLKDSKGTEVVKEVYKLQPASGQELVHVYVPVIPDYKVNEAGRWSVQCTVSGWKSNSHTYNVLPSTPDGAKAFDESQEQYKKAWEGVYHTFAQYWTEAEGGYMAIMPTNILHVRYLNGDMVTPAISPADAMNGITFRARVTLSFGIARIYFVESNEWGAWVDASPRQNEGRGLEAMRTTMGALFPDTFAEWMRGISEGTAGDPPIVAAMRKITALDFLVEERDGHWFVEPARVPEEKEGRFRAAYSAYVPYAKFVNGKQVGGESAIAPTPRILSFITNRVNPERVKDRQIGAEVRESPQKLDERMIRTIDALRGNRRY